MTRLPPNGYDVVPRRMLDLCRALLRAALARIAELEGELHVDDPDAPDPNRNHDGMDP